MGTTIEMIDVKDAPKINLGDHLPTPLRIGDVFSAHFRIEHKKDGRRFQLHFRGVLKVIHVSFEVGPMGGTQKLLVESVGQSPTWKAMKNCPPRILPPTRFPPTKV